LRTIYIDNILCLKWTIHAQHENSFGRIYLIYYIQSNLYQEVIFGTKKMWSP